MTQLTVGSCVIRRVDHAQKKRMRLLQVGFIIREQATA